MNQEEADALAARLIAFIEDAAAEPELFGADAFVDFTTPHWRVQTAGRRDVIALRTRGHPGPSRVTRSRCDPTPGGFVLEVEEEWQHGGEHWYCRELFRADVRGGAITELSVYCGGDWDAQRRAQHAREVRLLRP